MVALVCLLRYVMVLLMASFTYPRYSKSTIFLSFISMVDLTFPLVYFSNHVGGKTEWQIFLLLFFRLYLHLQGPIATKFRERKFAASSVTYLLAVPNKEIAIILILFYGFLSIPLFSSTFLHLPLFFVIHDYQIHSIVAGKWRDLSLQLNIKIYFHWFFYFSPISSMIL